MLSATAVAGILFAVYGFMRAGFIGALTGFLCVTSIGLCIGIAIGDKEALVEPSHTAVGLAQRLGALLGAGVAGFGAVSAGWSWGWAWGIGGFVFAAAAAAAFGWLLTRDGMHNGILLTLEVLGLLAAALGFYWAGVFGALTCFLTSVGVIKGVALAAGQRMPGRRPPQPLSPVLRLAGLIGVAGALAGAILGGWRWGWLTSFLGYAVTVPLVPPLTVRLIPAYRHYSADRPTQ